MHFIYVFTTFTFRVNRQSFKEHQNCSSYGVNFSFQCRKEKYRINPLCSPWSFNFLVILQLTPQIWCKNYLAGRPGQNADILMDCIMSKYFLQKHLNMFAFSWENVGRISLCKEFLSCMCNELVQWTSGSFPSLVSTNFKHNSKFQQSPFSIHTLFTAELCSSRLQVNIAKSIFKSLQ